MVSSWIGDQLERVTYANGEPRKEMRNMIEVLLFAHLQEEEVSKVVIAHRL